MAYPRNPNNMAIEQTVRMGAMFLEFMRSQFPERLGEGPVPERRRRLGDLEAGPIVQETADAILNQGVPNA